MKNSVSVIPLRLFGQKTLSHVDDLIGTGSDDEPDAIPRFP